MLLPRIEEYCRATGTAESTFGRIAVNDGKLVSRLRAGGSLVAEASGLFVRPRVPFNALGQSG